MTDYLVVERQSFKQDAVPEERDMLGMLVKPVRAALNESHIMLRVDRQFLCKVRVDADLPALEQRQAVIDTIKSVGLGEEVAPGVQVIEYECMLHPAMDAMVSPEEVDEAGTVVKPSEITSEAVEERESHVFTLRLQGLHIAKTELTDAEFKAANWKRTLATRAQGKVVAAL